METASVLELPPLSIGAAVRIDSEQPAREPVIVQAADGTLYVAGFWGFARHIEKPGTPHNLLQGPLAWKSTDDGQTWKRLSPGLPVQGAISNSDLDLTVADDGTLYLAALSYYSLPLPVSAPGVDPATTLTVVVGASGDRGGTWTWTRLDEGPERSHPWVEADPQGRAHVVWGNEQGIWRAESANGGATWKRAEQAVHEAGAAGQLAISPSGAMAVRVAPLGAPGERDDGVAVSTDSGETWQFRSVPGNREDDDAPHGFDPVAFDEGGALYFVWNEGARVLLARSLDLGASWEQFTVVEEPEGVPHYPYVRGGGSGQLALTWYLGLEDTVAARMAHASRAAGDNPVFRVGTFEADTGGTNHADYYQISFLQEGGLGAAVPVTTSDMGQWFDYRVAR